MSDPEDDYEDGRNAEEEDKFEDSSEEEEEEDEDKYEHDDFIVGDDDDDVGSGPEPEPEPDEELPRKKKKKKKRRYREDSPELAEGDLQLLEDEGVRVDRKKKLKRLRKGASDEELDELDEDVRNLAQEADDDRDREPNRRADEPVDYDDDMDDFIDDGGRSKRKRRSGHVSSDAVRQARSIFGNVDEMEQYKGMDKLLQREDGAGDVDDEDFQLDRDGDSTRLRKIRPRDTDMDDEDGQMPPDPSTTRTQDGAIAQELGARGDDTEEVHRILETDIPERLQLHFGRNYTPPEDEELRQEAQWVHNKGFRTNPDFSGEVFVKEDLLQKINICLSYIHIDKLDVPFISMYRKDYISNLLVPKVGEFFRSDQVPAPEDNPMTPPRGFNSFFPEDTRPGFSIDHMRGVPRGYDDGFGDWAVVWSILDLDKQYAQLTKQRQQLLSELKRSERKNVPTLVLEDVRLMAEPCKEENELRDGERYLRLATELAESLDKDKEKDPSVNDASRRPSRRRNRYTDFCRRGYRLLAREFGISARQFGENYKGAVEFGTGTQMHVPFESESDPLETAQLFAIRTGGARNDDPELDRKLAEKLLSAARFILATEIFSDMQVVGMTRRFLTERGSISLTTTPTPQGIAQVNDAHPLRCVTSIHQRPLENFERSVEFALICRAEELGYTVLNIEFQEEKLNIVRKNLTSSIVVESVTSTNVTEWNEQRQMIVDEVLAMLVRHIKEEVKKKLTEQTALNLRYMLTRAASRRLLLGPGRPHPSDDGTPRVLAFYVTREEDEEPDPLQDKKDLEAMKESKRGSSERRLAHERVTVVDLDENGEYANGYEIFAAWLRRPQRSTSADSKLSSEVKEQLKSFIMRARAQMIAVGVGSGGRAAVRLHQDLMDLIKEMVCLKDEDDDDAPRLHMLTRDEIDTVRKEAQSTDPQEGHTYPILSKYVVLVDDFPARIYAKTEWSTVGLPVDDMTILEKRAIGLARLAQEPLWVYSAIAMENDAADHLNFHPFHYYATSTDRRIAFHRALIRAVCTVGVDINRCLRLPHMQSMVPFVGGLGPHKGKALIDALCEKLSDDDRGLLSRKHLWSQDFVGRTVFLSAAAFLRVRDPELHPGGSTRRAVETRRKKLMTRGRGRRRDDDRHVIFDPMDDSRVHPEHYTVAHKIADESLRDDQGRLILDIPEQDEFSEQLRMTAAVLDNPDELNKLALDDYAAHLQELGRGSLFETVRMIASEYKGPFRDFRRPLVSPGHEALFYLVTGADPTVLRQGAAVTATNCQVRMKFKQDSVSGISCMLPHGIRGYIPYSQFSDEQDLDDQHFKHLVPDGSSLRCRITDFVFDKFEARLTSKVSLLEDPTPIRGYQPAVDFSDPTIRPYPVQEEHDKSLGAVQSGTSSRSRRGMNRHVTVSKLKEMGKSIVQHYKFKDISGQQANGILRSALPGDILIRPSQYNANEIVFSGKFSDVPNQPDRGVIHIPCKVMEDSENAPNSRLKIGGNIFEHVDQVIEEFVGPIISNLTETMDHRKFRNGTVEELKDLVKREKLKNPHMNPYYFGLSQRRQTSIMLFYIPGSKTVRTEDVEVMPDGFRFRSTLHMSLNALITFFKRNMTAVNTGARPPTVQRERPGASPFRPPAESPFHRVASPFTAGQSPFHAPQHAPSHVQARAPFEPPAGRPIAQPAADVPPPPAPAGPGYDDSGRRPRYDQPVNWDKATRQRDEPPPGMQNGGYNGHNAGLDRGGGRGMGRGPDMGPGQGMGRGQVAGRGQGMGRNQDGPSGRGPERGGAMPAWRGQQPVPAWVKRQQEQQQQ